MSPATIQASTSFLAAMAEAAARSLALGCLAAAALGVLRVKSVRVKLLVWRGVLVAALAMPALTLLAPAIRVAVPVPSFPEHTASAATVAPAPAVARAAAPEGIVNVAPRPDRQAKATRAEIPVRVERTTAPAPRRNFPWPAFAAIAYLAVATSFLARVAIGAWFGKRLVGASMPVEDARALQVLSAASRAAGLRTAPQLAESAALSVPVTLGIRRPAILFPCGWRGWAEDELAAVIAHEISHIERYDALTQFFAVVHRAVFWFSPLAWWLERHLIELAEQASDEAALAAGADRTRYAEVLLGFFAELEAAPERVWWQGVSMAKTGQAEKRVDRILAWRGVMSNKLTKSFVAALVVFAAPVVALTATVRPSPFHVSEPPMPAAPQAPATPAQLHPLPRPMAIPAPAPEPPLAITPMAQPALPALPQQDAPPPPAPAAPSVSVSVSGDWNFYRGYRGGYFVGRYLDWGPRFVIVTKDSDALTMSGMQEDAEHARALRSKIPGDFIWFERDEKSYVIRDRATVDRAKKLWEPQEKIAQEQADLGKQQEALGRQQEEESRKFQEAKLKVPDMTAELQKVEADMKRLSENGGTVEEIARLQSEIGSLQARIGAVQSDAWRDRGWFGTRQGELGRQQGELGRRQGELGRQQAELSREASRQMKDLLDDAVAHGLAQPE